MGRADYLKLGDWNALCDECGFKYKASQLRKRWDSFMVCSRCWEPRHPQDFIRGVKDDQHVPWSRNPPDVWIEPVIVSHGYMCGDAALGTATIGDI